VTDAEAGQRFTSVYAQVAGTFAVRPDVAEKAALLVVVYELLEPGRRATILSGYRTAAEQAQLERAGRPAAADQLSNHRAYPALAVDVSIGGLPSLAQKQLLGLVGQVIGFRWGGGSPLDPHGVPTDWQHFDLGPRALQV